MSVTRRPNKPSVRRMAVLAVTIFLSVLTATAPHAQTTGQFQAAPQCAISPAPPGTDTWPFAGTDSLGTVVSGGSVSFSGATLLANDTGASLRVTTVGPNSAAGGRITGSNPFTYTPAAGFTGPDVFTYEISDSAAQTTIGLVKAVVGADVDAPVVSVTAPAAGTTVSGNVPVAASATDNAAVVGVSFFDGVTPIGAEVLVPPYRVTWDTTGAANGSHNLTAKARDAAGNIGTSAAVAVTVSNGAPAPAAPTVDKMVFSEGLGKRTTTPFSTASPGEVLVAFAASDGPAASNSQTLTISGAGLVWNRVARAATQFGTSEIWTATASTVLTNVSVSSTQAVTGVHQSLTVIAFTGVGGIGASNVAGAPTGAPTIRLVTQAAGSVVYAVGNDWDRAVARTIPAGQTKVHEFVDTAVGDTFWVQAASGAIAAAGTTVTLNATAPIDDQWNFAIVELKAGGAAPATVAVPNIVGLTDAAARTAITGAGLTVGAVTSANSATVPQGQVISQNPAFPSTVIAGSAVSFVVSLGPAAAAAGPVLALSFNEVSGTVANDSSGNANSGSVAGATRVAGQTGFGGALSFDGISSIVNVAHSASLALSTGMTLEAWVNPSANAGVAPNGGWRTVILKERGIDSLAYALYGNDGNSNPSRPAGYIHNGITPGTDKEATAGPALPIGVWSHIAVTFDNSSIRLYVNGVLRSTFAAAGAIAASTEPLRIGGNNVFSSPGTEFFAGLIDEVRVYNRALSAAEITSDMNTPLP